MKKLITITVALLMAAMSLKAQEGEIIYRDFVPDTVLRIGYQQPHEIWIDFDNDNLPDLQMFWYNESPGVVVGLSGRDTYVKICQAEEGDTISQLSEWQSGTSYPHLWEKYAIRIEKEGEYCFGWFRTYVIPTEQNLYFDKFAFCTIPNYPLRWGQTDIVGVEENEPHRIAKLHPNPTTDLVRIEGVKCAEVQVYNALGQHVKTDQNTNEVSLVGLPQGVYLLHVTLENGKVFSEKVVKE